MNSIYLYLHSCMLKHCNLSKEISRKEALFVISRHLALPNTVRKNILRKMIELKLLEVINRDNVKIINPNKSKGIENKISFFDDLDKSNRGGDGGWFVIMLLTLKYMWGGWWL